MSDVQHLTIVTTTAANIVTCDLALAATQGIEAPEIVLAEDVRPMGKSGFLNVATDFTQFPAGRTVNDGPRSGETFCDNFLVPALNGSDVLTVQLDGTMGYGPSFLQGAFRRLVQIHGFSPEALRRRLKFESFDGSIPTEIWGYIEGNGKP